MVSYMLGELRIKGHLSVTYRHGGGGVGLTNEGGG